MADKEWDEMSPDEKANELRGQIESIAAQVNAALGRVNRRVSAIEADLKQSRPDP